MVRALDSRQCDGVFLLGDLRDDQAIIQSLIDDGQPVVALCRGKRPATLHTVNCDNDAGIQLLVEHLRALGHKRIAFLDGGWIGDIRERLESFLRQGEAVADDSEFIWLRVQSQGWSGGHQAMRNLLALRPRPTAVMASDDSMAIGALRAASEAGLHVPHDLSITGFDDISLAAFTVPALTTVGQPLEAMAAEAVKMLLEQVAGHERSSAARYARITPSLIVRESTGPCPP
jgi:LacI family transcriptional regulator